VIGVGANAERIVDHGGVESTSTRWPTFLFTDIEGSTRLWEQHPEAMTDALHRHDVILREAIERSGGTVVKTTGDGMMAVFDGARDAIAAAIEAERALGAEPWPVTGPLRVRMGLHAGPAEQRTGDYFGPTVNRTARIMAVGHGGQVLVSGPVAELLAEGLPGGAGLLDLGNHRLKDLGRPEHIFQVVHPDLPSTFPPLAAARPDATRLPARAAGLIGRGTELAQIRELLGSGSVRLLTLIGPGGTGKTTLAIRVADDLSSSFLDGVGFVDVSGARDTTALLVAIARAVGLGEVVDRPLDVELADWLRDRRMLLVLDNLEQVAGSAGAVADLLRECPGLTVLATSRQALHLRAERVYPVQPLSLPSVAARNPTARQVADCEAVQLFVDRARAVRPDFELTDENAPAIAEICRRLDGLPLAIELAAARLRLFSPDVLRDRLGDRLGLLRSGPRDLPERQQTLRATMDWSYDLLDAGEQRLFAFLAVFSESDIGALETVAAAAAIDASDDMATDILDGLAGLIEKSLLRRIEVAGGEPRVSMLETIREFATDRLDARPDIAARTRRAHATYYADLARALRGDLMGPQREAALEAMVADLGNLRTAWRYWVGEGDLEQLDGLADSLLIVNDARGWYLDTVTLTTDMLAVLETRTEAPDRTRQEIALRITLARALMATKGFTQEVEDALVRAVELFEQGADVRQQFSVLRGLASLYQFRAQFDMALRLGREILDLGDREHDDRIRIDGHLLVGVNLAFGDDLPGGLEHLERAISLFESGPLHARTARVANDPRVACLTTAGFALWLMGYPDRATERMAEALSLAAALEHPITTAYANFHAALLRTWRREPELAFEHATRVLEVAEEHELGIWTAVGRCLRGVAEVGLGRVDEGLAAIHDGMALYRGRRSPPVFWPLLLHLEAGAMHRAGRPADGIAVLDPAIEMMSAGTGASVLPEFYLLKGDMRAAIEDGSDASGAETWYRAGHDRAGVIGARLPRLRAATRLARLRLADGDAAAAATVLGPILETFTEGFGTADLQEAREVMAAAASA